MARQGDRGSAPSPLVNPRTEFDQIAPFYDDTRMPPSAEELDTLTSLLTGSRTVLDAGVGTGRFAVPLARRQFEIVGVDLSAEMMRRARAKGLLALLRADLGRLPLRDGALDAAFMAHVLQLLSDPRPVLSELGRVARRTVIVLILPEWSAGGLPAAFRAWRGRYREVARELGFRLPDRGQRYPHSLSELEAIAPPSVVREVPRPPSGERTLEERLNRWASLAYGTNALPEEAHREIVRRLIAERPEGVERALEEQRTQFVAWDAEVLRGPR